MTTPPVGVMKAILDNPKDIDNARALTTPDVTYVSLNYSNPELKSVMPWCSNAHGAEVIVRTFVDVGRFWSVEAFEPQAAFGDAEHAAMLGSFTYRSNARPPALAPHPEIPDRVRKYFEHELIRHAA